MTHFEYPRVRCGPAAVRSFSGVRYGRQRFAVLGVRAADSGSQFPARPDRQRFEVFLPVSGTAGSGSQCSASGTADSGRQFSASLAAAGGGSVFLASATAVSGSQFLASGAAGGGSQFLASATAVSGSQFLASGTAGGDYRE
jgi:hypothetical protein